MTRVFVLSFGFLAFAWYELSGGADFEPGDRGVEMLASYTPSQTPVREHEDTVVARADTGESLNALTTETVAPRVASVLPVAAAVSPAKLQQVVYDDPETMEQPAPAQKPVIQPVVASASSIDYREVTGSRVNLRGGPGTSYDVVTQLLQGEEVEVMDETGDGWVKLRALDGNNVGWMSADFLTASN